MRSNLNFTGWPGKRVVHADTRPSTLDTGHIRLPNAASTAMIRSPGRIDFLVLSSAWSVRPVTRTKPSSVSSQNTTEDRAQIIYRTKKRMI